MSLNEPARSSRAIHLREAKRGKRGPPQGIKGIFPLTMMAKRDVSDFTFFPSLSHLPVLYFFLVYIYMCKSLSRSRYSRLGGYRMLHTARQPTHRSPLFFFHFSLLSLSLCLSWTLITSGTDASCRHFCYIRARGGSPALSLYTITPLIHPRSRSLCLYHQLFSLFLLQVPSHFAPFRSPFFRISSIVGGRERENKTKKKTLTTCSELPKLFGLFFFFLFIARSAGRFIHNAAKYVVGIIKRFYIFLSIKIV